MKISNIFWCVMARTFTWNIAPLICRVLTFVAENHDGKVCAAAQNSSQLVTQL